MPDDRPLDVALTLALALQGQPLPTADEIIAGLLRRDPGERRPYEVVLAAEIERLRGLLDGPEHDLTGPVPPSPILGTTQLSHSGREAESERTGPVADGEHS